jgi:hypothetical protein
MLKNILILQASCNFTDLYYFLNMQTVLPHIISKYSTEELGKFSFSSVSDVDVIRTVLALKWGEAFSVPGTVTREQKSCTSPQHNTERIVWTQKQRIAQTSPRLLCEMSGQLQEQANLKPRERSLVLTG